jgi:hypothetical protein
LLLADAMDYTMPVVEVESGREHRLPADAVTRDASRPVRSQGPILPLAFRPRAEAFYVTSARWPDLAGKALRLKAT